MALSGLEIYKLLPKTNCRECGFPTCLAFAMQLAKKSVELSKCTHIKEEAKAKLEASSLPPIRLLKLGNDPNFLELGNETVLFRHEEKFFHPTAVGIILEDSQSGDAIKESVQAVENLKFERIGQELKCDLIALEQKADSATFQERLKIVLENSSLNLVLISSDSNALGAALKLCKEKNRIPIVYPKNCDNISELAKITKENNAPLVIVEPDLEKLPLTTGQISKDGHDNLIIDTGKKSIQEKLWDLTQIRRMALKKNNRNFGYPIICNVDNQDTFDAINEAGIYMAKYASIVLLKHRQPWQILSLLTLRQNIYTDPQRPLQVESKEYAIGQVSKDSPVLLTTNFSLSYYTVAGEVEASKVPSYIISVDTEGMSVLTAWAAEKFTPEKISDTLKKIDMENKISHKKVIIPGYVAVMSGDLEEKSGWQVVVGPKEASGLPSFLKKL